MASRGHVRSGDRRGSKGGGSGRDLESREKVCVTTESPCTLPPAVIQHRLSSAHTTPLRPHAVQHTPCNRPAVPSECVASDAGMRQRRVKYKNPQTPRTVVHSMCSCWRWVSASQGTWESLDLFARYRVVARLHQRH
eukprot:482627-Rhodomonas_salina.4